MFLTWRPEADVVDHPILIIGAGPAGLYLATRLSERKRVLVIEAGSLDDNLDPGGPNYALEVTGRPYPQSGSRLSAFGGTSNHWGGNAHPIVPELFAGGAEASWPIPYGEYAEQIDGARRFLNLAPFDDTLPTALDSGVLAGNASLAVRRFRVSDPMAQLGDDSHVAAFRDNPNIAILMRARVTDMTLAPSGDRVDTVVVRHGPSRETATIRPELVILATGGIENARLLLWSARGAPAGNPLAGGPNRLTGRNFTEKPFFAPVDLYIDNRADLKGAVPRHSDSSYLAWEFSDDFRRSHDLPRFGVFAGDPFPADPAVYAANAIYADRAADYQRLDPSFQFDQTEDERSYVALSSSLDDDGAAKAELHWEIAQSDVDAYRRGVLLLCGLLSQNGAARARLKPAFRIEDWSGLDLGYCNHHLGTTRMAASADLGVVDPDCRVFGLTNLFVAGSSVFPPSGYVNPTLSIVALAGRLADHLGRLL